MIIYNVFDIGELEKLKAEEAVNVKRASRSLGEGPFTIAYKPISTGDQHYPSLREADKWLFPSNFALSFGLLTDLRIFENVETLSDIRLGS